MSRHRVSDHSKLSLGRVGGWELAFSEQSEGDVDARVVEVDLGVAFAVDLRHLVHEQLLGPALHGDKLPVLQQHLDQVTAVPPPPQLEHPSPSCRERMGRAWLR